jgi:hypothetical protein
LNDFKGSARGGDLYGTARYRRHACFSLPMDESARGKMHEEINNAREVWLGRLARVRTLYFRHA